MCLKNDLGNWLKKCDVVKKNCENCLFSPFFCCLFGVDRKLESLLYD